MLKELRDCVAASTKPDRSWLQGKQDWCCKYHGIGCPATHSTARSDMQECVSAAVKSDHNWSKGEQERCCKRHGIACSASEAASTSPMQDGPVHDCNEGIVGWKHGWSAEKKAWCCRERGMACTTTSPEAAVTSPTTPSPATSAPPSSARSEQAAAAPERAQPTAAPGPAGRRAETPPPSGACAAVCSLYGESAACGARITWAAAHHFASLGADAACERGHSLVRSECDVCQACPLHEVKPACVASPQWHPREHPFDCQQGRDDWRRSWS